MAVTISPYNHTLKRYLSGENAAGDTYKVKLLTAATFNATHTTLAATGGTEVANGNGYTTGGATIANLTATIVSTSGAKLDADDTTWTASGGAITASYGIVYNDTDTDDPPLYFINFDGSQSAGDGTDFKIIWNTLGIATAAWS